MGDLEGSVAMVAEARRRAERFGLDDWLLWLRGESAYPLYYSGDWDESIALLDELIDEFVEHRFWMEAPAASSEATCGWARGDEAGARR